MKFPGSDAASGWNLAKSRSCFNSCVLFRFLALCEFDASVDRFPGSSWLFKVITPDAVFFANMLNKYFKTVMSKIVVTDNKRTIAVVVLNLKSFVEQGISR